MNECYVSPNTRTTFATAITILISDLIRCQTPAGVFLAGRGKFSAYS